MEVRNIAVIGAGTMGCGIAQTAAAGGFSVVLTDKDEASAGKGLANILDGLERRVSSGKLHSAERDGIISRIKTAGKLVDCGNADLVIEAVAESEEIKKEVFRSLESVCPPLTIFATNTSSISITRLAQATGRADRVIGMHFMNPVPIMRLVEVVTGLRTSAESVATITAIAEKMGKTCVVVADSPGFVSNRVLMPMINDAISCLHEGIASREGIDAIVRLGANHPMGPLELADMIGLDICLDILEVLHRELGEKYIPSVLLRNMVAAGKLGKKTGEGFYDYK